MTIAQNYIHLFRWHQPIGIWLLLWPVLIALTVSGNGQLQFAEVALFCMGAIASRSAGCAINDYFDRDIDRFVLRTKDRPIASKKLNKKQVRIAFMLAFLVSAVIALLLSWQVLAIAVIAGGGLIMYPLAKRFYGHPQIILGIVYSMGIPMAWLVGSGSASNTGWILLYCANLSWIYAYDTIYAMADKPFDSELNIYSSALSLGKYDRFGVACAQLLTLLLLAFWVVQQSLGGVLYFAIGVIAIGFIWQQYYIRTRIMEHCVSAFRSNHRLQFFLLLAIVLDYQLR